MLKDHLGADISGLFSAPPGAGLLRPGQIRLQSRFSPPDNVFLHIFMQTDFGFAHPGIET
jgi:hypothetical protein